MDRKDKKPFQRITGWKSAQRSEVYGDKRYERVEVTSIVDEPSWRAAQEVWIVKDGKREKVYAHSIYADTSQNVKLMVEITALAKQQEELRDQQNTLFHKLTPIQLPKDVE